MRRLGRIRFTGWNRSQLRMTLSKNFEYDSRDRCFIRSCSSQFLAGVAINNFDEVAAAEAAIISYISKISFSWLPNNSPPLSTCLYFNKWAIAGLFFLIFVCSLQLTVKNVLYISLPMTRFEPWTSGVGSDSSTNWATTTALSLSIFAAKYLNLSHT